ncbi:helix-turn-helix domain-containing protein [Lacticaseibacillus suibinensis]|uniref:helix-turn-helix domain-containing protein n=1 Tax=Lacticaseibacillus suibinensis TaxID=2486011 RepID=UPI000F79C9CE|nr:helix-turn-helix transcriptional regulator [Lacticaseibacillus suibinensis]
MKAGELIKYYRDKTAMSQTSLAIKSGVSQTTISAIEHGTDPTWENMKKLALALNITVDDLMGTEVKN